MTRTLNQLIDESRAIEQSIMEAGGEVSPEVEALASMSTNELAKKLDAYCMVLESLKARVDYAKDKAKDWKAIEKSLDQRIEYLESRLHSAMIQLNTDRIDGDDFTLKLQANPPKVQVIDESAIPGKYLITTTTTNVDKFQLLADLKAGPVDGAVLQRIYRIAIKPSQKRIK